ncbi:Uncharacterised protein [Bordetella pertussis]|nr:Uncharacterised protein [Bordetella pertussis]
MVPVSNIEMKGAKGSFRRISTVAGSTARTLST